jgi:hypothetical protein
MELLDKVKETAKTTIDKGQTKVNEYKEKRTANDLLRNLGLVTYAQRKGTAPAGSDDLATALVRGLDAQVQAHGPLPAPEYPSAAPATDEPPNPSTPATS